MNASLRACALFSTVALIALASLAAPVLAAPIGATYHLMHQPIDWPERSTWDPSHDEAANETITLGHSPSDGGWNGGWNSGRYVSNWHQPYRDAMGWTTSAGKRRLEPVNVGMHHANDPLCDRHFLDLAVPRSTTLDHFVTIARPESTGRRAAPWAKEGQVATYNRMLANESTNGWTGWFLAAGAQPTAGLTKAVTVQVLDVRGAVVATLHDGIARGALSIAHALRSGAAKPSGVYFGTARTARGTSEQRIVLIP